MLKLLESIKVYVFCKPVDMRKSINGLSILVAEQATIEIQSESLFVFYNKGRDKVKALYWHKNGFVLVYKRMERGKFKISHQKHREYVTIVSHQYEWLMSGLDYELMQQFPENDYEHYA